MNLKFNRIDKATFDRDIFNVLRGIEEQGQAKSGIYFDDKGNATTGIGFNLRSAETVKYMVKAMIEQWKDFKVKTDSPKIPGTDTTAKDATTPNDQDESNNTQNLDKSVKTNNDKEAQNGSKADTPNQENTQEPAKTDVPSLNDRVIDEVAKRFSKKIVPATSEKEKSDVKATIEDAWNTLKDEVAHDGDPKKIEEEEKELAKKGKKYKNPFAGQEFHLSEEFIEKAFKLVVQQKLENLEKAFPGHEEFKKDVYSYEKMALVSLRYNSGNTIGNNLKAAILDNDRFRAWFEIRHNTNKGDNDGAQKRRYYEAELFGLFNERGKPTDEEIKHILDTLPQKVPVKNGAASRSYLEKISAAENKFEDRIESAEKTGNAKNDYKGLPFVDQISHIGEAFRPLAKELLNRHLPEDISGEIKQQVKNMVFDGQVLPGITNQKGEIAVREYPKHGVTAEQQEKSSPINDPSKTNLLVGLPTEEVKDKEGKITSYEYHALTFKGSAGKDVMVGGSKNDTMHGAGNDDILIGKEGNDELHGEEGIDKLIGGAGIDTLNGGTNEDTLIGGAGRDILKGGEGKDVYVFEKIEDIDNDEIIDPDGGVIKFGDKQPGDKTIEYRGAETWTNGDFTFLLTNQDRIKQTADLQITVAHNGESRSFTIKGWKYTTKKWEYYVRGKIPEDLSFEELHGDFGITLKKAVSGIRTETEIHGDQVAPFKSDGKTYDWNKTERNYETGKLEGGKEEANFNDAIRGTDKRDHIQGFGGNDALDGGAGRDILEGGDGSDLLVGGTGSDLLLGGAGNDRMFANGKLEDDVHRVKEGESIMDKIGSRHNYISLKIDGSAWGVLGYTKDYDHLFGIDYFDSARHQQDSTNTQGDELIGGQGIDYLFGSNENDTLYGDEKDPETWENNDTGAQDWIYGMGGNDVIYGGPGEDWLFGDGYPVKENNSALSDKIQPGNDVIHGGAGKDRIYGGGGDDHIYGDSGNDIVVGEEGNDTIHGGTGNDSLYGYEGNDIIHGDADNDVLHGNEGDDHLEGDEGNDALWGEQGDDVLHGGDGDDDLTGDNAKNINDFGTLRGNDILYGGAGHDLLCGGWGDDQLHGGDGHDHLAPGPGNDFMSGGAGNDSFYIHKEGMDHKVIADFGDNDVIYLRDTRLDDYHLSQSGNDLLMSLKSGAGQLLVKNYFSLAPDALSLIVEMNEQQGMRPQAIFDKVKAQAPSDNQALSHELEVTQTDNAPSEVLHHLEKPQLSVESNPFVSNAPAMEQPLNLDYARADVRSAHVSTTDTASALMLRDAQLPQWGDLLAESAHVMSATSQGSHIPTQLCEIHSHDEAAFKSVPSSDSVQHLLDHWQHHSGMLG